MTSHTRPTAGSDAGLRLPDVGRLGSTASSRREPVEGRTSDVAAWRPTFGAVPQGEVTTFRVWAQSAEAPHLVLEGPDRHSRHLVLERVAEDLFAARVEGIGHGALYRYLLDGKGPYPDPASRFQPEGVHGPSQVVDWTRYRWSDQAWHGVPFSDLVIYELHAGTFTEPGSFRGIVDRLPYLADLGVTAI